MALTTNPSPAYGGVIARSNAPADDSAYTDVAYIVDLPDFAFTRETIEVTHTQSTDLWAEFIPDNVRMIEDLTFTVLDSPGLAIHQSVYDDYNTDHTYQNSHIWKITEPEGDTLVEFYGFVTGISIQRQRGEAKTREITIKVTGVPVTNNLT
jgi:hypothetical protein